MYVLQSTMSFKLCAVSYGVFLKCKVKRLILNRLVVLGT
jgi:hypothetical protein